MVDKLTMLNHIQYRDRGVGSAVSGGRHCRNWTRTTAAIDAVVEVRLRLETEVTGNTLDR